LVSADPHAGERAGAFLDRHRPALLVLAVAVGLAVLGAWIVAKTTHLLPPTTWASQMQAYHEHHGPLRDLALAVARLADAGTALATVAALAAYSYLRAGARAALLAPAASAVVVLTTVAKDVPGRETSLPSGHAAYAMAVGGYGAWLLLRSGHRRLAGLVVLLALAMAPARVIQGAHRPADVIAGVALGAAWTLAVLVLGRPWARRGAAPPAAAA
jgi:membrane-associated phospholipid phosphatase